jgi:hypothetical protein
MNGERHFLDSHLVDSLLRIPTLERALICGWQPIERSDGGPMGLRNELQEPRLEVGRHPHPFMKEEAETRWLVVIAALVG